MKNIDACLCPVCQNKLQIERLSCPNCHSEYPIKLPLSPYDYLTTEQLDFLNTFLKMRGNLKNIGTALGISYPTVKKRFDELLVALELAEESVSKEVNIDMSNFGEINYESHLASDLIRKKLYEHSGVVQINLLDGKPCYVYASPDGKRFTSDKLPGIKGYEYEIFDVIVDLLKSSPGHKAPKGNAHGREDKVGFGHCTEDTVVGAVAIHHLGKSTGESTYDPTFVLAAILDWAEIAHNKRGYIELSASYLAEI